MSEISFVEPGVAAVNIVTPPPTKEFRIGEIKRPLILDDVKDFQRQFREFDKSRIAAGKSYLIGPNQFYEYMSTGTFWGVEVSNNETPEVLGEEGKKSYEDLLVRTYQSWRENLIRNKEMILETRPKVIRELGDLTKLPDPKTAEEVRRAYDQNPKLNELSAASYQEGIVEGTVNNPFLHFKGHRQSGYEYEQPETQMRVYLNPPINEVAKLAQEFINLAEERGIPFYFKLFDFSIQEPFAEDLKRKDRLVFFTDNQNLSKIVGVLNDIKDEHQSWFEGRSIPRMAAKAMEGVGVAEEPSEYQKSKFSPPGEKNTSFNRVRAKFFRRLWLSTTKNIILQNPDLRPRGGRTLREIFNDFVPPEEKKYLPSLWKNNLSPLSNEYHQANRVLDTAITRTMADVIPNFSAESLMPWIKKGIEVLSQEYGIDPNNLAVNIKL